MNPTCCAHSKVTLKHIDYPGGTRSDFWECASGCGKRFMPEDVDMNIRNRLSWFAGMALQGLVANGNLPVSKIAVADAAFEYAAAMMEVQARYER